MAGPITPGGMAPIDKFSEMHMRSMQSKTMVSHEPIAMPKMTKEEALKQASLADIEKEVKRLQNDLPVTGHMQRMMLDSVAMNFRIMNAGISWLGYNPPFPKIPLSQERDKMELDNVLATFKDCQTDPKVAVGAVAYLQILKNSTRAS